MSRILLAEDDRVIRDITVMYLTKNGLQVDVTDNGNSACQLIEMNRYDCIVLDIMMPGKDGREVCRLIRNKYDVPVIFLTALGEEHDIIEGYEVGADEYVTKPRPSGQKRHDSHRGPRNRTCKEARNDRRN